MGVPLKVKVRDMVGSLLHDKAKKMIIASYNKKKGMFTLVPIWQQRRFRAISDFLSNKGAQFPKQKLALNFESDGK